MLGWLIFWGTGMKMMQTLESWVSQHDLCFADCVVPGGRLEWETEKKRGKKRKKWVISKGVVGKKSDILNALGHKYH